MRDYNGDFVAAAHSDPIALVEANFFPYLAVPGMTEEVVAAVRLAIANFIVVRALNQLGPRSA